MSDPWTDEAPSMGESADWSKSTTQGCKHTMRATRDTPHHRRKMHFAVIVHALGDRGMSFNKATTRVIGRQGRWSRMYTRTSTIANHVGRNVVANFFPSVSPRAIGERNRRDRIDSSFGYELVPSALFFLLFSFCNETKEDISQIQQTCNR